MTDTNATAINAALADMSKRELGSVKVFMVEDDQMIRELVVAKLTQSGCIPFITEDGSEAIKLAEHYQPDVIILDLMLPGMTGEEVLTTLKSRDDLRKIPVVVFSNKSEDTDKDRVMGLGADRYYVKAYTDLNELVADLRALVGERQAAG